MAASTLRPDILVLLRRAEAALTDTPCRKADVEKALNDAITRLKGKKK